MKNRFLILSVLALLAELTLFGLGGYRAQAKERAGGDGLSQLWLPYYMSEQNTLPMQAGAESIRWTADQPVVDASTGKITAPGSGITEVNLEASVPGGDTKKFSVKVLPKGSAYVVSYTREKDDSIKGRSGNPHGMYQSAATDSMHLGYSADGNAFEALNYNTGILFAKNQGEKTKVIKQPYIFRMKDGSFGILAVRTEEDGEKGDQPGQVLFFTSEDLVSYKEVKQISLSSSDTITDPACVYDKETDAYYISWTSAETGESYVNRTVDFDDIEDKTEGRSCKEAVSDTGIPYAIESNVIAVSPQEAEKLRNKFMPVVNTTVDEIEIETEPGKPVELAGQKVTAHYSDGSAAQKNVTWNESELAKVDYSKEGVYEVSGTVRQLSDRISEAGNYPFIAGRADPNVAMYNGKYYFIATNESGNVNLYIRESDTVAGLNEAEEHLVYDEAKGAEGDIVSKSNHWAPELHNIGGELYMLFATNIGTGWDVQSVWMKLKTGGDPTRYEDWEAPKRCLDEEGNMLNKSYGGITLDMTYFSYNDRHYLIWSQRNFSKNGGTADLWIGETTAENPGQLIRKAVKIVSCEYSWERNHQFVTEGPFVILTDDTLYMTYSGGATDETYCIGLTQITLSENVDFLDADAWKKSNYPIMTGLSSQGEDKYHGPGHNSYVTDEEGNLINVFHARPGKGTAFQRDAFLRVVHFSVDGTPVLDMEEPLEILPENKQIKMRVTVKEKAAEVPSASEVPAAPGVSPSPAAPGSTVSPEPQQIADGKPTPQPEEKEENQKGKVFSASGMKYKITGDKTAEFVGARKKDKKKLTIPASVSLAGKKYNVTGVGAKACLNNKKLKQVKIGKNVTKIGARAFRGCRKLKNVQIQTKKLKKVGENAFGNIHKKAVVKVPSGKKKSYRKLLKGVKVR